MSEFLRIFAPSEGVDLRVLHGDGPATPTGGVGGWQQVARTDAKSMTEWSGNDTFTQDIPVLLNGFKEGNVVQGQANDIIALGRKTDDDEVPPVFRMVGAIWMPWLPWVLEDVEWTDEVIRDDDTRLLRQEVVLKVAEFEDPDQVKVKRIRHPYGTSKGGGTNFPTNQYIVRKGDNLVKIATKVYGDRTRWKKLSEKNDIRDPHHELEPGRIIKLPVNPWAD